MSLSLGQRLFVHGGVYSFSKILNQSIGFFILPVYTHLLGDVGYGIISLVGMLAIMMGYILEQGLSASLYRLRFDEEEQQGIQLLEGSIVWYLLATIVVVTGGLYFFGDFLANSVTPGLSAYPYWYIALAIAAGTIFCNLLEKKYQIEQKPLSFMIFSALRAFLTLSLILVFVVLLKKGAFGKIFAEGIALVGLGSVAIFLIGVIPIWHFSLTRIKASLVYGLPFVPHLLAMYVNSAIDRFIINAALGLGATGIYDLGYKIASIGTIVCASILQAFSPIFLRTLTYEDNDDNRKKLARFMLIIANMSVAITLGLVFYAKEIISLISTDEFDMSVHVVFPAAGGMIAITLYSIFVQPIFYNKKYSKLIPLISIIGAFANIVGNYIVIPYWGIIGAAWATTVSNSIIAYFTIRLGVKAVALKHSLTQWIYTIVLFLAGLFVAFIARPFMQVNLLSIVLRLLMLMVIVMLSFKICRISLSEIKQTLFSIRKQYLK